MSDENDNSNSDLEGKFGNSSIEESQIQEINTSKIQKKEQNENNEPKNNKKIENNIEDEIPESGKEFKGFGGGGASDNFRNNNDFFGKNIAQGKNDFDHGDEGNGFRRSNNYNSNFRGFGRDNQGEYRGNRGFRRDNYRGYGRGGFNYNNNNNNGFRYQRPKNAFDYQEEEYQRAGVYGNNFNDNRDNQQSNQYTKIIENNIDYIRLIQKAFVYLTENDAAEIFQILLNNTSSTIFEITNTLSRENICKHTIQGENSFGRKNYIHEVEIFEAINANYINENHKKAILYYKVFKGPEEHDPSLKLEENYYYKNENEKRRILKKTEEGYYNYLPIKCKYNHEDQINSNPCIYAHNDNEINYHSLMYHTKLCRINKCDLKCPNAHDLLDDFRMIYDYTNEEICALMYYFHKKFKKIDNYEYHLNKMTVNSFNISNFKVIDCKSKKVNCKKDSHLCYYYHEKSEKRRSPLLFKYSNEICQKALDDDGSKFIPSNCPFGDFCHKVHSNYELFYHVKNFQKIVKCTRKKVNKKCKYYETCYGKHDEEKEQEVVTRNVEQEKEDEFKEKYHLYSNKLKSFGCFSCGNTPTDTKYCLLECGDILCTTCFKQAIKNFVCLKCDKKFGEKTTRLVQICPHKSKKSKKKKEKDKDEKEKEKSIESQKSSKSTGKKTEKSQKNDETVKNEEILTNKNNQVDEVDQIEPSVAQKDSDDEKDDEVEVEDEK